MRFIQFRAAGVLALIAFLAGCAMPAYQQQPQQETFTGHKFWYEPTNGTVGYHMSIGRYLARYKGTTSAERGCTNGDLQTAGIPGATSTRDLIVSGSLPPGIDFNSSVLSLK